MFHNKIASVPTTMFLTLWATPRSTSTAFEWMMRQRGDFSCFHEPFNELFYYGEDRRSQRDASVAAKPGHNYAAVWADLCLLCERLCVGLLNGRVSGYPDFLLVARGSGETDGHGAVGYLPMAIALINDPTLLPLMDPLEIDAYINPRATTVSSILRHIRHGRVRNVYSIGDAEAEVIEAQILSPSSLSGRQIRDIDFPEGVLVGAVMKGEKVIKPDGDTRIDEGDVIVVFAQAADVPEVERLFQVSIDFF